VSGLGKPIVAGIVAAALLFAVSGPVMGAPRRGSSQGTASISTADSGGQTAAPAVKAPADG
jgi:hypothetical protein